MIRSLRLDGFLSFAPGSEPFELRPLLGLIDPARVQARCRHCKRLFDELGRIIAAAS